jgi:hypothetical protein
MIYLIKIDGGDPKIGEYTRYLALAASTASAQTNYLQNDTSG